MSIIKGMRTRLPNGSFAERLLYDVRLRTVVFAVVTLIFNMLYSAYNCVIGIRNASLWFVSMCFYYALLGVMRFRVIWFERRRTRSGSTADLADEYGVMRKTGAILLLLTAVTVGDVVLLARQNHVRSYGKVTMITIAAYTFYKVTAAVVKQVKIRKQNSPALTALRNICAAEASMSVLSLQSSMIATFDKQGGMDSRLMTALTGFFICAVYLYLGISMIIISRRRKIWLNQK